MWFADTRLSEHDMRTARVGIDLTFWGMRALVSASILKRALPR